MILKKYDWVDLSSSGWEAGYEEEGSRCPNYQIIFHWLDFLPGGESQPPTNNWITDKLGLVPWFQHRHHLRKYI